MSHFIKHILIPAIAIVLLAGCEIDTPMQGHVNNGEARFTASFKLKRCDLGGFKKFYTRPYALCNYYLPGSFDDFNWSYFLLSAITAFHITGTVELAAWDPVILQYPEGSSNFSGSWSGRGTGELDITSDLDCIDSSPTEQICAEPGHKLALVALPYSLLDGIPQDLEPTIDVDFRFTPPSDSDTSVKAMSTIEVTQNGQTYLHPMMPGGNSFASVPELLIRKSTMPQNMEFSGPAVPNHDYVNIYTDSSYTVDESISGSWYMGQEQDYQGWNIQVTGNKAVIYWFTASTTPGEQTWLVALGDIQGSKINFTKVYRPNGASFGSGYNPDDVTLEDWGQMAFVFESCNKGFFVFGGDYGDFVNGYWSGDRNIQRITGLSGHPCGGKAAVAENSKAGSIDESYSGGFYDPSHDGEGWLVEVLNQDLAVAYWYTYDSSGKQVWLFDVGEISGNQIVFDNLLQPKGATFGQDSYNPNDVTLEPWGSMTFTFDSCSSGSMTYQSSKPGFGSGSLNLVKIYDVDGLPCM